MLSLAEMQTAWERKKPSSIAAEVDGVFGCEQSLWTTAKTLRTAGSAPGRIGPSPKALADSPRPLSTQSCRESGLRLSGSPSDQ